MDGSPRVHGFDKNNLTPCRFGPDAAPEPEPAEPEPAHSENAAPEHAKRLLQFSGHVELSPEGEPLRVHVLIAGAPLAGGPIELGEDGELSIGDAVDLALTRAGRRLLSVDVR